MKANERTVIEGIHRFDTSLTLIERVRLYRAIASTSSSENVARHFHISADDLAAADEKIGQRLLVFRRNPSGE